jgi:hypothetical protein
VEFKSQLERETGKTLPLGALLRARSLNDLATQLLALP